MAIPQSQPNARLSIITGRVMNGLREDETKLGARSVRGSISDVWLAQLMHSIAGFDCLVDAKIDETIVERYYQSRSIRRVGEAF